MENAQLLQSCFYNKLTGTLPRAKKPGENPGFFCWDYSNGAEDGTIMEDGKLGMVQTEYRQGGFIFTLYIRNKSLKCLYLAKYAQKSAFF